MKPIKNIIDTLEELSLSKSFFKRGIQLDFYKLRYSVILRIQDGKTKYNQLLELGEELTGLNLLDMGGEERIHICFIRFACFKDTLSWEKAFNSLMDAYKYAEFTDGGVAYVLYSFGRLLYDYEEMLDDINQFQKNLFPKATPTKFIIDNKNYKDERIYYFYDKNTINKEQYKHLQSLLKNNLEIKELEFDYSKRWFFPNLFFKNAIAQTKQTKMHYQFWYALSENKRGKFHFYKSEWNTAKNILGKNIGNYKACLNAGGDLPANIIFNHAECLFFLAMSQLCLSEKIKAIVNLKKSIEKFKEAILLFDQKGIIDSEYTYRRSLSDYRHMYLVAINELIKVEETCALKYESKIRHNINCIRKAREEKLEFYKTFLDLKKNFEKSTKQELLIDGSQFFEKQVNTFEQIPYEEDKPMRFGIAFNDNYYRAIFWNKLEAENKFNPNIC